MVDKPHTLTAIYAVLLIVLGFIGYFFGETKSFTAFIPSAFGLILLAMVPGIKSQNKIIAHVAVLLVLLLGGFTFGKSISLIQTGFGLKTIIFLTTAIASIFVMVIYVKGFIAKKNARKQNENK